MTLYIITDGQENNYDFTNINFAYLAPGTLIRNKIIFLLTYSITHDPAVRFK